MTATRWRFGARGLVQRNMLARILRRPGARPTAADPGRTISTLRDDAEAISMMGDWAFDAVAAVVFAAGSVVIMLAVDARVTVLVMVPVVVVVMLAHAARSRLERLRARSRAATADVTGTIGDLVSAAGAIRAAGREDAVVAHLRRQGDARRRAVLRDELLSAWLDAIFAGLASVGAGLILLVAAGSMRDGRFTIGDFVLFSTYLLQVTEYTGFIGYLARSRRQAKVSFRRAAAVMSGVAPDELVAHHPLHLTGPPPPPLPPPPARAGDALRELRVECLTARFPESGGDRGIHNVGFTVRAGTLTVVAGRVGAGKTTLLRTILGLLPAQSGTVRWNGVTIHEPGAFLVPPRAAYTPQSPSLLSGTLRDNVLLGLPAGELDEAVHTAVHTAALDRDVTAMPGGLDTQIGVGGLRLSGGQVLRTAAARMLVRQAELVVFDDLSSGLDGETEAQLWDRVLAGGATCLVASHRRTLLARADQIVVLDHGRVVGVGTHAQLIENCPEFRVLLATETTPEP